MSILETFYIMFKSNASEVKKDNEDIEKSSKKVDESLSNIGKNTSGINNAFTNLGRTLTGVLASVVSISTIIAGLRSATDYAVNLGNISRLLGVNVEELDAWGNAVKRTGGTAEAFQSSLRGLSEHLGGSPALALKVLPQLADVFSKIGRVQSFRYGKMLGLDEATILLLQQGRREIESVILRQKELGVVTKQDQEISQKFNFSLLDTKTSFRGLYLELSTALLPILTKFLNVIVPAIQYLREHIELVKGAFIGVGVAVAAFLAPFVAANAAVIALVAGIGALIGLFALAYEDIKYFLQGNESLTGDILKRWPRIGTVVGGTIKVLQMTFREFADDIRLVIELFSKLFSFMKNDSKLSLDIKNSKDALSTAGTNFLTTQTSNSIFSTRDMNRNTSVNTGDITIQTQATYAPGIAAALGRSFQEHLWQSNSYFDDGVAR